MGIVEKDLVPVERYLAGDLRGDVEVMKSDDVEDFCIPMLEDLEAISEKAEYCNNYQGSSRSPVLAVLHVIAELDNARSELRRAKDRLFEIKQTPIGKTKLALEDALKRIDQLTVPCTYLSGSFSLLKFISTLCSKDCDKCYLPSIEPSSKPCPYRIARDYVNTIESGEFLDHI